MWAQDVKNKMGFLEWNTHDNPVIWSEVSGKYIGGCSEFRQWADTHLGRIDWNAIDAMDVHKVAEEMLAEHKSSNKPLFADLSPCGPKVIAVVTTPSTCISEVFRTLKEAEQSSLFLKPPYLCVNDFLPVEGSQRAGEGQGEQGRDKDQETLAESEDSPIQLTPANFERAIQEDKIVELEDSKGRRGVAVEVLRRQSSENNVLYFHATLRGCRTLRRTGVNCICFFLLPRNLDSVLSNAKSKNVKEKIHELVLSKMEKGLFDDVICSNDAYAVYHRLVSSIHQVWEENRAKLRPGHLVGKWDAVKGCFLEEADTMQPAEGCGGDHADE
ncbi:hypothetical protein GUITHDRAFT_110041 [Guillardia theta CCMP2712]|uniref:Guanylate kinase-like domain-containing protein n=1 Tax=Guillardia theta (strain CCMP2712) TaxID=905079 RepID=L1J5W7_GUITC|nr:hypothetical protein GUITHDRAFT_110041 [Guillardia theta CCMP2712]EKX43928.1 hypothetical protein GUITHDRAFT_110041 [Guillardia theta CCMP2712]|eukprot:XP_005830908.1 hypothetical protein GUITHDRAFT_110041 [Guillardia theta CCMP2712]